MAPIAKEETKKRLHTEHAGTPTQAETPSASIRDTFLGKCYPLIKPTGTQKYLIQNTVLGNFAANRKYCTDLPSPSFAQPEDNALDLHIPEMRNPAKSTFHFFYQNKEDKAFLNTCSVSTGRSIRDYMGASLISRPSKLGNMYASYEEHLSFPYSYQFTAEAPHDHLPKDFLTTSADILRQSKDQYIRIEYCKAATEDKDLADVHWGYGDLTGRNSSLKLICASHEMTDAFDSIIHAVSGMPIALFSIACTYTDRPVTELLIEFENEIDIHALFSELAQQHPSIRMMGLSLCIDAYHIYISGSHSTQIEEQRVRYERTWDDDNYHWLKANNPYWGNPDWQNPDIYIKNSLITGNLFNWSENVVISEDLCKTASRIGSFQNNKYHKTLIAPPGLKQITTYAFFKCSGLKSIWLPGVANVGEGAFSDCRNLRTAWLPAASQIRSNAFGGCRALEYVYLSQNFKNSHKTAFRDSKKLKILAPEDSAAIRYFQENRNVTEDFVLEGNLLVSYIGNGGTVLIPEGIVKIDDLAFANCTTVTEVFLPASTAEIGSEAFKNCIKLTKIHLPHGLKKIGMSAFERCVRLEEVILPEGITEIDIQVFYDCKKLRSVQLPTTLTTIKDLAFGNCSNLNAGMFPESAVQISDYAFVKTTGEE